MIPWTGSSDTRALVQNTLLAPCVKKPRVVLPRRGPPLRVGHRLSSATYGEENAAWPQTANTTERTSPRQVYAKPPLLCAVYTCTAVPSRSHPAPLPPSLPPLGPFARCPSASFYACPPCTNPGSLTTHGRVLNFSSPPHRTPLSRSLLLESLSPRATSMPSTNIQPMFATHLQQVPVSIFQGAYRQWHSGVAMSKCVKAELIKPL